MITGVSAPIWAAISPWLAVQPTIFAGDNSMRDLPGEIFGPAVSVTSFADYDEAIRIANDTLYGLGAGVEPQRQSGLPRRPGYPPAGCGPTAHQYPAHAAFGGYKQSGIGRENHKMLDHHQQTKNLLVSHSDQAAGFF